VARALLSAGGGAKGRRRYVRAHVKLADLRAEEYNDELTGPWTRRLLIRRSIADRDLGFVWTWCAARDIDRAPDAGGGAATSHQGCV
jgi:SRSO17 transposase